MRKRGVIVGALLALVFAGSRSWAQKPDAAMAYDEFVRLGRHQRFARFAELGAADKALLMRTHLLRWSAGNRDRLTRGQLAVIDDALALLSPGFYEHPRDPVLARKARILESRVACVFDWRDAMHAFSFATDMSADQDRKLTWMAKVSSLFGRLSSCAEGYVQRLEN
jgi:hypothetical protein